MSARWSRPRSAAAALWLLSLFVLLAVPTGFAPGPRLDEAEAAQKASFVPEFAEYYGKPTVETTATYDSAADAWRVVLTEATSGDVVARLVVDDDSGEVSGASVSAEADEIEYPTLSEDDATRLALASPEVREELSKHGSYTTDAEYEDGRWTVHFYIEERGLVGGKPAADGRKEVAEARVDDETWELEYVWTGDQVGWQMARGEVGAYGKHANYAHIWGPLALVFALAFLRTDKLFSLRNLDVVALLGFLVSHGFFREGVVY
ncbi:MAG TPA: hypothetical protein VK869_06990, partial [Rubrobacteraceae bacterium]|nr:hypothetical protein [Rubrobacteraceae bacterium]